MLRYAAVVLNCVACVLEYAKDRIVCDMGLCGLCGLCGVGIEYADIVLPIVCDMAETEAETKECAGRKERAEFETAEAD